MLMFFMLITHGIDLVPGSKPLSKPPYCLSASEASEVKKLLADYLLQGFIHARSLPWALPILMVCKKDDSMHMCVYYHALKALSIKNKYPLP